MFVIPRPLVENWQLIQHSLTQGLRDSQKARINAAALDIWRSYNLRRRELGQVRLTNWEYASAYHRAFHLPNLARQMIPLERSSELRSSFLRHNYVGAEVVDLGCGSGAASLGLAWTLRRWQPNLRMRFWLMDRSEPLLKLAEKGLMALRDVQRNQEITVETVCSDFADNPRSDRWRRYSHVPSDSKGRMLRVILMSYVWNEIERNRKARASLLRYLQEQIKDSSTWLLLNEPATEVCAKRAMRLRDELCSQGWLAVYPCSGLKRCPMLTKGPDWCFSELPFRAPSVFTKMLPSLARSQRVLGSSSYAFVNPSALVTASKESRIVGRPTDGKSAWFIVCNSRGLRKLTVRRPPSIRDWAIQSPRGITFREKDPSRGPNPDRDR